MSEDLLNVFGSFSEVSLDCIEKQNEELEQLEQENKQLKEVIEEVKEYIEKECSDLLIGYFHNRFDTTEYYEKLLQILDKIGSDKA